LPPPSSLQLNRLYTSEFIKELKERLSPDGHSVIFPAYYQRLRKPGREDLNSILYYTLRSSFRNVMLVPGGKTFFIASDSELSLDIPGMIERKGISTSYVNRFYLDVAQMKERSVYMNANISKTSVINHDFRPLMFFAQMKYWMTFFNRQYILSFLVLLVLVLLIIFNLNPVNAGLFAGGFTVGAFQVLILLSMQIYCGYVFQLTGIVIMLFMFGLAVGSRVGTLWFRSNPFRVYLSLQLSMAGLSVLIPMTLILIGRMGLPLWMVQSKAAMITVALSVLTGMEYSLAFRLSGRDKALNVAKNYSADLFGSALGAFMIPVFLFPLLGADEHRFYTGFA